MTPDRSARSHRGLRTRYAEDRAAVIVELAIVLPIFMILITAMFDIGLAFNSSRKVESTVRDAARIGAAANTDRLADYEILRTVKAVYDDTEDQVEGVTIYRSAAGTDGVVPLGCGLGEAGVSGTCNTYTAANLAGLDPAAFTNSACTGDPDELWCPVDRGNDYDNGDFLGVRVWIDHDALLGFWFDEQSFSRTAVFQLDDEDNLPLSAGACYATLYTGFGGAGESRGFGSGDVNIAGSLNNSASSIAVQGGGCVAFVTQSWDGEGDCRTYTEGTSDMGDFNDETSYIWVGIPPTPGCGALRSADCTVTFHSDVDFGGDEVTYADGGFNLVAPMDDTISSVAINDPGGLGCIVFMSDQPSGQGDCRTITADQSDLGAITFDDEASYVWVGVPPAPTCDPCINANNIDSFVSEYGDAVFDPATDTFTLTEAVNDQAGAVMSDERIDLKQDFTMTFEVYLGAVDAGADGLSFMFHDDPAGSAAIGSYGSGLGMAGITNAVGIEFDTYNNSFLAGSDDIANDHTAIYDPESVVADAATFYYQGSERLSPLVDLGDLENGVWRSAEVAWDADAELLSYSLDGTPMANLAIDLITDHINGDFAYFGFAGGTGDLNNQQQLRFTSVSAVLESDADDACAPLVFGNAPPILAPIPDQSDEVDITIPDLIATASDAENDPLTFTGTGLPPGLTLDPDGTISGTPNTPGTYNVTITVTDPSGGTDSVTFTWTIFELDCEEQPGSVVSWFHLTNVSGANANTVTQDQDGRVLEFPVDDVVGDLAWWDGGLGANVGIVPTQGEPEVVGPDIFAYSLTNLDGSVGSANLGGIDHPTFLDAYFEGDYLAYGFTTAAGLSDTFIESVSFLEVPIDAWRGDYERTVIITPDDMATFYVLDDARRATAGADGLPDVYPISNTGFELAGATDYEIRIYLHTADFAEAVVDDFGFQVRLGIDCTGAPQTPYDPCQPDDADCDGVPNDDDLDDDNDGIADIDEGDGLTDTDGDGIPDSRDLDSDGDGISDLVESGQDPSVVDTDGDGELDDMDNADPANDNDADNDGLSDAVETVNGPDAGYVPPDSDGDGVRDDRDLDSDDDGIPDVIEAQPTTGYAPPIGVDSDGDGVDDAWDTTVGFGGDFPLVAPVDIDGDGTPDYLDADSDGDGTSDTDESGLTLDGVDANGDGIDDGVGASYSDPDGIVDDPSTDLDNELGDTTEVAYRETNDTDGDGVPDPIDIDDDNDGILDVDEVACARPYVVEVMTYTATGAGAGGVPSVTYTVPDGQNRAVFVAVSSERDHTPPGYGDNWDGEPFDGNWPSLWLGGVEAEQHWWHWAAHSDGFSFSTSDAMISQLTSTYVFYEADILPGPQSLDLSGFSVPQNAGDEMIVTIVTFADTGEIEGVGSTASDDESQPLLSYTAPTASSSPPTGTSARDNLVFSLAHVGTDEILDPSPGWTLLDTTAVSNASGTYSSTSGAVASSENDGSATRLEGISGLDGPVTSSFTLTTSTVLHKALIFGRVVPPNCFGESDTDGDGVPNHLDLDSDNDGISDLLESGQDASAVDANGDGELDDMDFADDSLNNDANGNGLSDAIEAVMGDSVGVTPVDSDLDASSLPDYLDLDSDDDGIPDVIEGQPTTGYAGRSGIDTDGDGVDDSWDTTVGFGGDFVESGQAIDTDADGDADYRDTDADGDGQSDTDESGLTLAGQGLNGHGSDDAINASYLDPDGDVNDPTTDLANAPGTDTTEVAYREVLDADGDGVPDEVDLDDDNDGIADVDECGSSSLVSLFSTSAAAYAAASDDEWVAITAAEYAALASGITDTTVFGTPAGSEKTGTLGNFGSGIYTFGHTNNPSPSDVYVYAFKRAGTDQLTGGNDVVRLSTASNGTGFNIYGSALPDGTVESQEEHWVLKNPSTLQTSPVYLGLSSDDSFPIYYDANNTTGLYQSGSTSTVVANNNYGWSMQGLAAPTLAGGCDDPDLDTDGDGIPNRLDLDSDNDGISDLVESGQDAATVDTNGDGELDDMDNADPADNNDADGDGLSDAVEAINGEDTGQVPVNSDGPSGACASASFGSGAFLQDASGSFNSGGSVVSYTVTEGGTADGTITNNNYGAFEGYSFGTDASDGNDTSLTATFDPAIDSFVIGAAGASNSEGFTVLINGVETDLNALVAAGDATVLMTSNGNVNGSGDYQGDSNTDNANLDFRIRITGPDRFETVTLDEEGGGSGLAVGFGEITATFCNPVDFLDLDSDDDGIPDVVEGQATDTYTPPSGVDADGDGIDDAWDSSPDFGGDFFAGGLPPNTDGLADGADYVDTDADEDSFPDADESGLTLTGVDDDGDGIDDGVNASYTDPDGDVNDPSTDLENAAGTDLSEVAYREVTDTDGDGVADGYDIDDDNDGITDLVEAGIGVVGQVRAWGDNGTGRLGDGTTTDSTSPVSVTSDFVWSDVAAGSNYSCAVNLDGELWCWGNNANGQFGNGTTASESGGPVRVGADSDWASVSVGGYRSTCAVKTDATLWCWGYNYYYQATSSTTADRLSPVQVGADTDWAQVDVGDYHVCGVKTDATVWCWGYNYYGEVGNGASVQTRVAPVSQVGSDTDWVSVTAGQYHSCGVKTDGTAWCWGEGGSGRLGYGSSTDQALPVQVTGTDWEVLSAGNSHTCGVKTDGTAWCFGNGANGRLGNNATSNETSPVQVGSDTDWSQIVASSAHSCAVKDSGTAWCWGVNTEGRLGDGTVTERLVPTQVGSDTNWVAIEANDNFTLAIAGDPGADVNVDTDGDGVPNRIDLDSDSDGISDLIESGQDPLVVDADNTGVLDDMENANPADNNDANGNGLSEAVEAINGENQGQRPDDFDGDGVVDTWDLDSDADGIADAVEWQTSGGFIEPVSGDVDGDGVADSFDSVIGHGASFTIPQNTDGLADGYDYVDTDADQDIYNDIDESGLTLSGDDLNEDGIDDALNATYNTTPSGDITDPLTDLYNSPGTDLSEVAYREITDTDDDGISDGYDIDDDNDGITDLVEGAIDQGALVGWGYNASGQVGDGTTTQQTSPVTANAAYVWDEVSAGNGFSCAVSGTAELWCWGQRSNGRLGDGATSGTARSPKFISQGYASVSATYTHACGLQVDATLWCWGVNSTGQVGNGSTSSQTVPGQVGAASDWVQVETGYASTCAVNSSDELWCWGNQANGRLGNGITSGTQTAPIQVGAGASWASVTVGNSHACATRTDGTAWCWGNNGNGRLGDATTTQRTTPVQVGIDTDWLRLTAGDAHTCGITTAGTAWCWGLKSNGRLGDGTSTGNQTTPLQVGTDADWLDIDAGYLHTCATKTTGTGWCWGSNGNGRLGDASTTQRTTPTQVGTDTTWRSISAGYDHTAGRMAAENADGELDTDGDGTPNRIDLDSDGDGISDLEESGLDATIVDTNGDGELDDMDFADPADNNDVDDNGLSDAIELAYGGMQLSGRGVDPINSDADALADVTVTIDEPFLPTLSSANSAACAPDAPNTLCHLITNAGTVGAQTVDLKVQWEPQDWLTVSGADINLDDSQNYVASSTAVDSECVDGLDCSYNLTFTTYETGTQVPVVADFAVSIVDIDGSAYPTRYEALILQTCSSVYFASSTFLEVLYGEAGSQGQPVIRNTSGSDPTSDADTRGQAVFAYEDVSSFTISGLQVDGKDLRYEFLANTVGFDQRTAACAPVVADYLDLDSDNDGIPDAIEAQPTTGYAASAGADADGDGADDTFDGVAGHGGNFATPINTDGLGDGADYIDRDADQDAFTDDAESGLTLSDADQNADGIDDGVGASYADPNGIVDDPTTDLENAPGTDTSEVRYREITDTDGDGIADGYDLDDDNDGVLDRIEAGQMAGALVGWGYNNYGQVGDATTTARTSPVSVDADFEWAQVEAGASYSCAIHTDGTLWCWGSGGSYRLGNNSTATVSSGPVQIGTDTDWATITVSENATSCAIKTDATLWCWGLNSNGQAGVGSTSNVTVPTQVGTDSNWAHVDVGSAHTCATRTDATLWCWGTKSSGRLGDATTSGNATAPIQIGVDTDWTQVDAGTTHTCGVKNDGTAWCWGSNSNGRLGDGTTTQRTEPTQVGTDTDWRAIETGDSHTCALKTGDTLHCWGNQSSGRLGDGAASGNQTTPVQIGGASNWAQVDTGSAHSCGVRRDGTAFCWGSNGNGRLGDGTTTQRTVPTQIDAETDWLRISAGTDHTEAIKLDLQADLELDTDGDGAPNRIDLDSDNDGISDIAESGLDPTVYDTDGDGEIDDMDQLSPNDADNDGLSDAVEAIHGADTGFVPADFDGDGLTNPHDLDADGDGIPDAIEGQTTLGFIEPAGADADGDGVDDAWDTNAEFGAEFPQTGVPIDTDRFGDGDDYVDVDADGDAYLDADESGLTLAGTDNDGDGIDDALNASYSAANGDIDDPSKDLYNSPGTDKTEVAYREITDTDGDGIADGVDIDDDNDGILDVDECGAGGYSNFLTTSAAAFSAAGDLDWVSITASEYEALASGVPSTTRFGTPVGSEKTGTFNNFAGSMYTFGHNNNPSPAGVYVYAFKRGTGNPAIGGNDIVRLSTSNAGVGFNQIGSALPDGSVESNEEFFILKAPTLQALPVYLGLSTDQNSAIYFAANNTSGRYTAGSTTTVSTLANGWSMQALATSEALAGDGGGSCDDTDADGVVNSLDLDSDNDGISDLAESGQDAATVDTNNDGELDDMDNADPIDDNDLDNDGLSDAVEAINGADTGQSPRNTDVDSDSIPDYLDLDSDADGIPDIVEAQPTIGYTGIDRKDDDDDGVDDVFDTFDGHGGSFVEPVDTDAAWFDDGADYLDDDSDVDLKLDIDESGLTLVGTDTNEDGIDDGVGAAYLDPDGIVNDPQSDLANELGDTTEVAYREAVDTDGDGLPDGIDVDDDNDGITDVIEDQLEQNAVVGNHFWTVFQRNYYTDYSEYQQSVYLSGDAGTNVVVDGTAAVIPADGLYSQVIYKTATPGLHNNAFEISSDAPITVVAESYALYSSEAWVVLPTVTLGTEYTAIGYAWPAGLGDPQLAPEINVVASKDDTVAVINGNAVALDAGEAYLYTGGPDDYTGIAVTSNKPIGVISGRRCLNTGAGACDIVGEQLFPNPSLSSEYYVPALAQPHTTRIVATENNTEVRVDGTLVATLNKGSFHQQSGSGIHIETSEPTVVYMIALGGELPGDPVFVLLPGAGNAVTSSTFSSPQPLYQNYISVMVSTDETDSVMLDGNPVANNWTPFADDPDVSYQVLAVSVGVHTLTADAPFVPIIYGETDYGSYGFVAGFGNARLGGVVIDEGDNAADDVDGDGVLNSLDLDSDNDGISDLVETGQDASVVDTDSDGVLDDMDNANPALNNDANNNGLSNALEAIFGDGVGQTPLDEDSDNRTDYHDLDSDADGIPDVVELQPTTGYVPASDPDADGIENDDADGDGVNDAWDPVVGFGALFLSPQSTDGDGIPDYLDTDSDGDTVEDSVESGLTFTGIDDNFDGIDDNIGASFSDPDGAVNDPTVDLTNGGGDTTEVAYRENDDTDEDGVPDASDLDNDNDGILDVNEGGLGDIDQDDDGELNFHDLDSDNDGISDLIEAGGDASLYDLDNDGRYDGAVDVNGIPVDANLGLNPVDSDDDGDADYKDLDSDADGIPDAVEAQESATYVDPVHTNNIANNGVNDSGLFVPHDTDLDGVPDYLDLDSDLDEIFDADEAGGGVTATITNVDADVDPTVPSGLPSTGSEFDFRVPLDTDNDNLADYLDDDDDNDGVLDVVECAVGDPFVSMLSTSLSSYQGASDGDWVSISASEYNALASIYGAETFGTPAGFTKTGTLSPDFTGVWTYGQSNNPSDANVWVIAFKRGGTAQLTGANDLVRLSSDPAGTGFSPYGTALSDGIVDSDEQHWVMKMATVQQTTPTYLGLTADEHADIYWDAAFTEGRQINASTDDVSSSLEVNGWSLQAISLFAQPGGTGVGCADTDGDGVSNRLDLDSDNDGISDLLESGQDQASHDSDNDGIHDNPSVDVNGVPDDATGGAAPVDTDLDGVDDYLDLDADDDLIPDAIEARTTGSYTPATFANNADNQGVNDNGLFVPVNSETYQADATPDYLDTDSDNDTVLDSTESGIAAAAADGNGDGIDDGTNASYADPDGDIDDPNSDLDNEVGGTSEVAYREFEDFDGDNVPVVVDLDDDNDGLLDTEEGGDLLDTDGDGVPNRSDLDSDNDGMSDLLESGQDQATYDTDNDGIHDNTSVTVTGVPVDASGGATPVEAAADADLIPDYLDLDSDGDLIPDAVEARGTSAYSPATFVNNTDNQGVNDNGLFLPVNSETYLPDATPDYLDTDSDNDTAGDAAESGMTASGTDANTDGIDDVVNASYADPDGIIDNPNTDLANEVGNTAEVAYREFEDFDADNIPAAADLDDDNDGLLDTEEGGDTLDTDGDGAPNRSDLDSDNDGISDLIESGQDQTSFDVDNDGAHDGSISAGGVPDDAAGGATPVDTDLDGVDDYVDLDADDDLIPDAVEARGTSAYTPATFVNNADSQGVNDNGLFVPVNSETYLPDATPDYRDTDSDNDSAGDDIESGMTASGVDATTDGIDDVVNASYADPDGNIDDPNSDLDNEIGGTSEVAYREFEDFDGDAIPAAADLDDDNDGLLDTEEGGNTLDTDGDGVANRTDLDSDNDGISDLLESGQDQATYDTDNDGIHDNTSIDANGVPDDAFGGASPIDTDLDGLDDYLDLDSDNDLIPDAVEAQTTNTYVSATFINNADNKGVNDNGLFVPVTSEDYLPDTTPDWIDTDTDNDGYTDAVESGITPAGTSTGGIDDAVNASYSDPDGDINVPTTDLPNETGGFLEVAYREVANPDGDGLPSFFDLDDDNDGVLDTDEGGDTLDTDGDSVVNRLDLDSDNDGISDLIESGQNRSANDFNRDGVVDGGSDANGVPTKVSGGFTPQQTDADSIPDMLDLDSDDDLIPDVVEAQRTSSYSAPTFVNNADNSGVNDTGLINPVSSDVYLPDGIPDWIDADSDNDGMDDRTESGITPALTDNNSDGIDDAVNASYGDPDGDINDPNTDLANEVGGVAEVAYREFEDDDQDNIPVFADLDDDNDGLLDTTEGSGLVDTDGDGAADSKDLDSDNDGISDLIESGQDQAAHDADNDGLHDGAVTASGIPTAAGGGVSPIDTDLDTIDDHHDLDSDGDLIPDAIEAQATLSYSPATFAANANNIGVNDNGLFTPPDTFADGDADYVDLDSDDDGATDQVESGLSGLGTDVDSNGIDDGINATYTNPGGDIDDPDIDLDNEFGDTIEVGFRERVDDDGDGIYSVLDADDDNDGMTDVTEGGSALDSDGDGVEDRRDVDSDNDGISDLIESGQDQAAEDADNDGRHDGAVDGAGVATVTSGGVATADFDIDGIADHVDLDSDGDLIPDVVEARATTPFLTPTMVNNADNAGRNDDGLFIPVDTSLTGTGDFRNTDSDDDGAGDLIESGLIADGADLDNDGIDDGINASYTAPAGDVDIPSLDLDNEFGDTTEVAYRERSDFDSDGVYNAVDLDRDGDGILNTDEGEVDTDSDGVVDSTDLDSDNDGISDLIESGQDHTVVDVANDGRHDGAVTVTGVPLAANGGLGATRLNSDPDGITDEKDLDADGDGIPDAIEAQATSTYSNPTHLNNDANDGINDNGLFVPIDTESDGTPDYLDLNSDTDSHTDEDEAGSPATPTYTNVDASINPSVLLGLPDDGTDFDFRVFSVVCVDEPGTIVSWFHITNVTGPNADTDTLVQDGRVTGFPVLDLNTDLDFWDEGGTGANPTYVDGTGLDAVIGAGFSKWDYNNKGRDNLLHLEGIDAADLAEAIAEDEYVEYGFTTQAAYDLAYIDGVSFTDHPGNPWAGDYERAVLISDDNFSTYTVLDQDYLATEGLDILPDEFAISNTDHELVPGTDYTIRVYVYGNDKIVLDDFGVVVRRCT